MSKKTVSRHYYAEFSPYGIRTLSEGDRLMRFDSREERDAMVDTINDADLFVFPRAQEVTLREVAHRYRVSDFHDADRRMEGYPRTCRGRCYHEIAPR